MCLGLATGYHIQDGDKYELDYLGQKFPYVAKATPNGIVMVHVKVYIYCTKGNLALLRDNGNAEEKYKYDVWEYAEFHQSCGKKILGGKVIGEFVCDAIISHCEMANADIAEQQGCIKREWLLEYAGDKELYGWHISDLVIYDKPKELSEFCTIKKCKACKWTGYESTACIYDKDCKAPFTITRPPQSWCYVEETELQK